MLKFFAGLLVLATTAAAALGGEGGAHDFRDMQLAELEDKLRGGMLGQVLGNLNALPHEFHYTAEPGSLETYTPNLAGGARTDDDTDIEWVYLRAIASSGEPFLPPQAIGRLWRSHINRGIACSNLYARQLMELEIEPPWSGNATLNPWAEFNISGQFLCESFGLMAPGMPRTAARLGLNYTHVAIDGEPAQTTQFFATMISLAFLESDLNQLLAAGLEAVDSESETAEVVKFARSLHQKHPTDWRAAREAIKRRWFTRPGVIREENGYELNTACTVAALLYGNGDFNETVRIAINLGWDCDNNAATAATIIGVVRGRKWMREQGWPIADVYRNRTRDNLPEHETLTGLEDSLIECARIVIAMRGGEVVTQEGVATARIPVEAPRNVEHLHRLADQEREACRQWRSTIDRDLSSTGIASARAAYLALCFGEVKRLQAERPEAWREAVASLANHQMLVWCLFQMPDSIGEGLRDEATKAGLSPPVERPVSCLNHK